VEQLRIPLKYVNILASFCQNPFWPGIKTYAVTAYKMAA